MTGAEALGDVALGGAAPGGGVELAGGAGRGVVAAAPPRTDHASP